MRADDRSDRSLVLGPDAGEDVAMWLDWPWGWPIAAQESNCGVSRDVESSLGSWVDLDDKDMRGFLANAVNQDHIATFLGRKIGELLVEAPPFVLRPSPIRLSETAPFLWRRQPEAMDKMIFNEVATFNPFETAFGAFLARHKDVRRFTALAEQFTGFWVDYMKPSGAIGRYFPDWVAVQRLLEGA